MFGSLPEPFGALDPYNTGNPLGRVVQEMIFDFRPHVDRERRPDVAFVSFEGRRRIGHSSRPILGGRARAGRRDYQPDEYGRCGCPELEEYYKAGVILVWVVYPGQTKVYAYTSTTEVRVLAPRRRARGRGRTTRIPARALGPVREAGEPA